MSGQLETRHFPEGEPSLRGNPTPATTGTGRHTLLDLSHRLRPRDYTIAALLDEHTTLTTEQLTAILFRSTTTGRHRLQTLRQLRFVDRFVRVRPAGPNQVCWVPGPLSARYTALAAGQFPPTARALRERQDRIYARPALNHLLAANQFFVDLLVHARAHPGTRLARWWSERSAAVAFGRRVHSDGHGVWTEGPHSVGFHLELDRGTEPLRRLIEKLASYRRLRAEGGAGYPVLFALPNRLREQHLHRRLADHPEPSLVIATTSPESGCDPAGPVWRLAGNGRHRLALAELPSTHGTAGPLDPGPPQPDDDPLRPLVPPA